MNFDVEVYRDQYAGIPFIGEKVIPWDQKWRKESNRWFLDDLNDGPYSLNDWLMDHPEISKDCKFVIRCSQDDPESVVYSEIKYVRFPTVDLAVWAKLKFGGSL